MCWGALGSMPADKQSIGQTVKKLDKELISANKLLVAGKEIEASLANVMALTGFLEAQGDQDAVFTEYFKEVSDRRVLIARFKELDKNLSGLKKFLEEIEPDKIKADLFLEGFRDFRTYYFPESSKAFELVSKAFELFSLERAFFKIQFLGTVNLNDAIERFSLQKQQNQSLLVPRDKIAEFLPYVQSKGLLKKSRLDNESLRILFNSGNELFIEADNAKIRRLDQIAKQLDAETWDS